MNLPLKLAILVIVIFGLLVTGMVLWKPMKVRYYAAKLESGTQADKLKTIMRLLEVGEEGWKVVNSHFRGWKRKQVCGECVEKLLAFELNNSALVEKVLFCFKEDNTLKEIKLASKDEIRKHKQWQYYREILMKSEDSTRIGPELVRLQRYWREKSKQYKEKVSENK